MVASPMPLRPSRSSASTTIVSKLRSVPNDNSYGRCNGTDTSVRTTRSICMLTRSVAFDLGAVQQAAFLGSERVAAMHDAAVVPHDQIAHIPVLHPRKAVVPGVCEQFVEKRFALVQLEPDHVRVEPAPHEERFAAGHRMRADDRMRRPRGQTGIRDLGKTGA